MNHVPTLIVGAGPTGFGAAWALERAGRDYRMVESRVAPGGAASSRSVDGFSWDLGGHVIHSHFPDFDEAIAASGTPMRMVERGGAVWFRDQFVATPYQQQLERLPDDIRPGAFSRDLDEYFRNEMGAELQREFFAPFNLKMWAHPLRELSHTWTSLRAGSSNANVPQVGLKRDVVATREYFPYPVHGTGDLWRRLAEPVSDRLTYGVTLVGLDLAGRVACFDDGRSIRYDELVSTIPLDELTRLVGDPRIEHLGSRLVRTETTLLGLGIRGELPAALSGRTYIYNPDPAVTWHRASLLSTYSPQNAPDGHWSVLFEANSSRHQRVDDDALARSARTFLQAVGADLGSVVTTWSDRLTHGYPVPTIDRDTVLAETHGLLERHGVASRGRFGGWRYESCNQDYSFAQGVEAIDSPHTADVLWFPEKF